ncbi:hypothetical protein [Bacillus paramycoides]|nr:hypothetical protein [Bacillus paramycoides]
MVKAEDISIKQFQEVIQQKNNPFINQVKIFINKHFQELLYFVVELVLFL